MACGGRGGDTSGCPEAWGRQLPLGPHPEAETSKSCLPGLATGGAGGIHLSPWPVEAGRVTQLCPEQMNWGGQEVRTRTRPPPAPRKALAAGVAWRGVAGRHGPADEEGREAQQGAHARAPHANMVSCNHCRAEGGERGQPGQKPQVRPPSSMAQESPSPHPLECRWARDPPGEGGGTLSYLLDPWEPRLLAPVQASRGLAHPSQDPDTQACPCRAQVAGLRAGAGTEAVASSPGG